MRFAQRLARSLVSLVVFAAPVAVPAVAAAVAAAAESPALGPSELRCDAAGCKVGPCLVRSFLADPILHAGGLRVVPQTEKGTAIGFKLYRVQPGSFPAQLGLQNNDLLRSINGKKLVDPAAALDIFEEAKRAPKVVLTLLRSGQEVERTIELDHRPLREGECAQSAPPAATAQGPTPVSPKAATAAAKPALSDDELLRRMLKDIVCKGSHCVLKNGVVDRVLENQALLLRSCRVVPLMSDGKVTGLKLFAIRNGSLFHVLGLRNGDLLQTVGGYDLKSPETALEAYIALRKQSNVAVVVERAGHPLTLTYKLEPAKSATQ